MYNFVTIKGLLLLAIVKNFRLSGFLGQFPLKREKKLEFPISHHFFLKKLLFFLEFFKKYL